MSENHFPDRLWRKELVWREKEDTIMNGESKAAKEKLEGALGQERGYQAVGGEILLLLIPFLYYIIERIYRNFTADIRKFWAECEEDEE